jgi:thioredoxin-like negative regulator of GroEL
VRRKKGRGMDKTDNEIKSLHEITDNNFKSLILDEKNTLHVVLYVLGKDLEPCIRAKKLLTRALIRHTGTSIEGYTYDVSSNFRHKFDRIKSIPFLVGIKYGKAVLGEEGIMTTKKINKFFYKLTGFKDEEQKA